MKAFQTLFEKRTKRVIGLMSGTSADGVDAALVEICGHGLSTQIDLIAFDSFPFDAELRARIFRLFDPETSRVDEICQMNFLLGEKFAESALLLAEKTCISIDSVDLIGCHGQTIHHLPPQMGTPNIPSTLQIGEAAVIAHQTGIPTIEDFRVADVAAGGQGAPLVPYIDFPIVPTSKSGRLHCKISEVYLMSPLSPRVETLVKYLVPTRVPVTCLLMR